MYVAQARQAKGGNGHRVGDDFTRIFKGDGACS